MSLSVIILAAGKGTRMHSRLPKVLQPLAGQPLLGHVLNCTQALKAEQTIVVYGHGGSLVKKTFSERPIVWVEQAEQLGTGHAVKAVLPVLPKTGQSLILYGDVPLITAESLHRLQAAAQHGLAMITLTLDNPMGYGRIKRENGQIVGIVEQKDATIAEQAICEVNTGLYCVDNARLHDWLPQLTANNAQGEYYLTDIVALAARDSIRIGSITPQSGLEVEGINDRLQLADVERRFQYQQAQTLMRQGVTLLDPRRFDLRGTVTVGQDVRIDANVIIEGTCHLGAGVHIGAGCILKNVTIGDDSHILPYSVIEGAEIANHCHIGPFARIRPGTELAAHVHIGNFVEVKHSKIAAHTKAGHLSYLGNAVIGEHCNIGAGTITCNYDGAHKHTTTLGNDVFIGSNSALVAPVTLEQGATVGAGSVITRNIAAQQLGIARGQQRNIEHYQRPRKDK